MTPSLFGTGFATSHPDLRGKAIWRWDFFSGDSVANVDYGYSAAGHGTRVAVTIAAATNNGVGVSGTVTQAQRSSPPRSADPPGWIYPNRRKRLGYQVP